MTAEGKLLDDCFLHDKDRLLHAECLSIITERLDCVADTEKLSLRRAHRRFLAETLVAGHDVPLHTNSAVDGYAFARAEVPAASGQLPVVARIVAGDTQAHSLGAGEAARIFTGATLPDGADTVAMQEDCQFDGDRNIVALPTGLKLGSNVRHAGEDLRQGDPVVESGAMLRSPEIAAIASLGIKDVLVHKPVRVALLSSGDELVQPGEEIRPGETYDSNRIMLAALASSLPVTVSEYGAIPDRDSDVRSALSEAAASNDLIVTSGGASRGEEDHIVEAIAELGKRHIWQVAIKPGRPMAMGQIGQCVVLGLPGNPVAAFVCFLLYCRPAITLLGGGTWREPPRFKVTAGFGIEKKKPDRREFWRGWLETDSSGNTVAIKFPRDGSGLISGLRRATGLIEVAEDVTSISEGDPVSFIPFEALGIPG